MSLSCPIDERPIYTMHYSRPFQELCILSFHWKLYIMYLIIIMFWFFSWQQLDCFDPIKHQAPFCSVYCTSHDGLKPVPLCAPPVSDHHTLVTSVYMHHDHSVYRSTCVYGTVKCVYDTCNKEVACLHPI